MAASTIHREYRFGRHWSGQFKDKNVSLEVSRERALDQHSTGEGYTVLILENGKPSYVVVVGTGTKIRGVQFLDASCQTGLSFQFSEIEEGRLFLKWASVGKRMTTDDRTGGLVGIAKSYTFSREGKVTIEKIVSRGPLKEQCETWVAHTQCDPSGLWEKTPPFGEFDPLIKRDRVDLAALEAQCPPESWVRQGPPPEPPKPYDKAAYHDEAVAKLGLPEEHTENHTLFFLRWLLETNLVSEWYLKETAETREACREGKATVRDVYRQMASALMDDMLSAEGAEFVKDYYSVSKVRLAGYPRDYEITLQGNLASSYHVPYTEENYQRIRPVIDRRYQDWKRQRQ